MYFLLKTCSLGSYGQLNSICLYMFVLDYITRVELDRSSGRESKIDSQTNSLLFQEWLCLKLSTSSKKLSELPIRLPLSDLKSIYEQVLVAPRVDKQIHSTRFKDCLLESIPGLCESRNGRVKLLSLDGETGRTVFETGDSFCEENSIVLA